jgi:hypothetical protein
MSKCRDQELAMERLVYCSGVVNGGGENILTVSKASVVMDTGVRPKDSAPQQCNDYGIYYG